MSGLLSAASWVALMFGCCALVAALVAYFATAFYLDKREDESDTFEPDIFG